MTTMTLEAEDNKVDCIMHKKLGKKMHYSYSMDASIKRCVQVVESENEVRSVIWCSFAYARSLV
jgi:hypothetical protein